MAPRAALLLSASLLGGCGLLLDVGGDDPPPRDAGADSRMTGPSTDAGAPVDAPATDGATPARFCANVTSVRAVDELNTSVADWGPQISPDGLTLYFGSARDGGAGRVDIYEARRPARGATFGPAVPVAELNSAADDDDPSLSLDGLTICFGSDRGPRGLFIAKRAGLDAPWAPPEYVDMPNSLGLIPAGCELSIDPNEIIFTDTSTGPRRLYVTRRATAADPWSAPVPMAITEETRTEMFAGLSADGLVMMFGGTALDVPGDNDVWITMRPALGAAFGAAVHVPALSGSASDSDPDPSPDGTEIWFASERNVGTYYDLFVATVSCP